eukprot:2445924-Alexandrium_andersonii.AAC.1
MTRKGYMSPNSAPDLDCVEYFSGAGQVWGAYVRHGKQGEGFDICRDRTAENLMTSLGFGMALLKAWRLRPS